MNFELVLYGLGLSSFLIVWPITDLVHLVNSSLDARWAKIWTRKEMEILIIVKS